MLAPKNTQQGGLQGKIRLPGRWQMNEAHDYGPWRLSCGRIGTTTAVRFSIDIPDAELELSGRTGIAAHKTGIGRTDLDLVALGGIICVPTQVGAVQHIEHICAEFDVRPGQWNAVFVDQGFLKEEQYLQESYVRWLYTAVTRATDQLFLVNFHQSFFESV